VTGQQNQKDALIQNLEDAGCTSDVIEIFMQSYEQNITTEQLRILTKQRGLLLENVRSGQRKLDCLDHLLYRLKKEYAV
jgi:hypothetical protein